LARRCLRCLFEVVDVVAVVVVVADVVVAAVVVAAVVAVGSPLYSLTSSWTWTLVLPQIRILQSKRPCPQQSSREPFCENKYDQSPRTRRLWLCLSARWNVIVPGGAMQGMRSSLLSGGAFDLIQTVSG